MEFSDQGVVLAARAHGESHAIADILTETRGRWSGLVYGGQGTKQRPVLQAGNDVRLTWKGRVSDSLGHFSLELERPRAAALMQDRISLAGLSALAAVAAACLNEREPHDGVYQGFKVLLAHLDNVDLWPALMARWELGLLAALGFGLTLDKCAATGTKENLVYVSPKSAQAGCQEAGAPYHEKMLALPGFLSQKNVDATHEDALCGLRLTAYFLETRVLWPSDRTLPQARQRVLELLQSMPKSE